MSALLNFVIWVVPLVLVGATLALWSLLVLIQSPRPYWRDTLNISLGGILGCVAIYALEGAGEALGLWAADPIDIRILVVAAGGFATIGLPRTVIEVRETIDRRIEERARQRVDQTEVPS